MTLDAHPELGKRERPSLRMGELEVMPILSRSIPFLAMNESTVCTVETVDVAGAKRGAIALGISRHDLPHGFVVYQSVDEAEAMIGLMRNAIDDAKRIEAGTQPVAIEGRDPPVKH